MGDSPASVSQPSLLRHDGRGKAAAGGGAGGTSEGCHCVVIMAPLGVRHVAHWRWGLMSISIVQLGAPRKPGEGPRLGTVRRPPRGVPKSDFARLDYYDVWFPNLSPSAELLQEALHAADVRAWAAFARKFRRENERARSQPRTGCPSRRGRSTPQ